MPSTRSQGLDRGPFRIRIAFEGLVEALSVQLSAFGQIGHRQTFYFGHITQHHGQHPGIGIVECVFDRTVRSKCSQSTSLCPFLITEEHRVVLVGRVIPSAG